MALNSVIPCLRIYEVDISNSTYMYEIKTLGTLRIQNRDM